MVKVRLSVAQYIEQQVAICGRSQKEIADEIGYPNANIITMFKKGLTKVPLPKVGVLAKALGVDPAFMMRLVMGEYMPETWEALEQIFGTEKFVTADELALIKFLRKETKNMPIDLSIAENRQALSAALVEIANRDHAKAEASVAAYDKRPPNKKAA
jgi:hypothetical protein